MRSIGVILLASLAALANTGCTYPIVMSAVRRVPTRPGTKREEVVKVLGQPRRSQHFDPATLENAFADAPAGLRRAHVSICDEYRINGLVVTSVADNPYAGFPEAYTIGMYLTLGLAELFYFPVTMTELIVDSNRHSQLRLWYDRSGTLIAEDRRR